MWSPAGQRGEGGPDLVRRDTRLNEPGPRLIEVGPICSSVSLKLAETCVSRWALARTPSDPRRRRRTRPGSPGSRRTWPTGPLGGGGLPRAEGLGRVREAYPGATWDRLVEGKTATTLPTCSGTTRTSRPPPWPQPPGRRARRTCRIPTPPVNNRSPRLHAQRWRNCRGRQDGAGAYRPGQLQTLRRRVMATTTEGTVAFRGYRT
jgi:hypothetical protein